MRLKGLYMLGRCANGAERDKGRIVHAVWSSLALCGRAPGRRSAGWTEYARPLADVNCPRCRRKLDALAYDCECSAVSLQECLALDCQARRIEVAP